MIDTKAKSQKDAPEWLDANNKTTRETLLYSVANAIP
jgi:hypothetical protein